MFGASSELAPNWAMYPVHGRVYVFGSWTWHFLRPVYTAVYGSCTRLWTGRVHGRKQPCTRSTAVFTVHTRLCTRAVNTPVYRYMTVYTVVYPVHGRVCGPMYTAVHGHVQTVYTAVHGPCTWPSMTRTRPCLRPCTRSFMACTDRVHHDTMHTRHRKSEVDNRNLLDGYYWNAIIRSLEIDLFTFLVAVTFWVTM